MSAKNKNANTNDENECDIVCDDNVCARYFGTAETLVNNIEPPVVESVKLCIELDKEMQKQWELTKEDLENLFEYVHGKTISLSNNTLFQCLLFCYDRGWSESIPLSFVDSFSKKEVEVMPR